MGQNSSAFCVFLVGVLNFIAFSSAAHADQQSLPFQSRIDDFNAGARSWSEARDHLVIKQKFDMSCGAAALASVLQIYYGAETDETDIMDIIGLRDEYSFAELASAAGELGYRAVPLSADFETLIKLQIPVVLFINSFGAGHFTVFKGSDGHNVWLGDPAWGNVHLAKADFLKRWHTGRSAQTPGQFLVILKPGQKINEAFFGLSNAQTTTFFMQAGEAHTAAQ